MTLSNLELIYYPEHSDFYIRKFRTMIDKLRSMAVFVRVVEAGSFRRAAERLDLSASVISHHISQLENEVGANLLYRSTRHFALTAQGERFYEACRNMVYAAEEALDSLSSAQVSGRLWLVAPTPFSVGPFLQDVSAFCKQYPEIELKLEFDDNPRNLIQEGIDLAIRFGEQNSSSLVCRRLFSAQPMHCAAPSYLERYGQIRNLKDFGSAQFISLTDSAMRTLRGPKGEVEQIELKKYISVNSIIGLHQLTLAGLGISELPSVLVMNDINSGRLVEVLSGWKSEELTYYAIFPAKTKHNSLSRLFVDFFDERMRLMKAQMSAGERHINELGK